MNINWIFNHLNITVRTGNPVTHQQSQFVIGGTTADNTLTISIANKSDYDFTLSASQCLTVDLTDFISAADIDKITMSNAPSDLNHITMADAATGWQMNPYAVPTGQGNNTDQLLCISDPNGLKVPSHQTVSFSLTNITVAATPAPPTNHTTGKIDISVWDTKSAGGAPTSSAVLMPLSFIFYKYLIGSGDPTPVNAEDFDEYAGDLYVFGLKSGEKNTSPNVEKTTPNRREYKLNYTGADLAWTKGNEPEIQVNFLAGASPQAGNISTTNALNNFSLTVNESAQQYWTVGGDLSTPVPSRYVKPPTNITSIPKSAFPLTLIIDYGDLYLDDTLVSGSDLPQTTISIAIVNFNHYGKVTLPVNIYTNFAPYIKSFSCAEDYTLVAPGSFTFNWDVLNNNLGPVFEDNPDQKLPANSSQAFVFSADGSKTLKASIERPAFQMTQKVSCKVIDCAVSNYPVQGPWQFAFDIDCLVTQSTSTSDGKTLTKFHVIDITTGAGRRSTGGYEGDAQMGQGTNGFIPVTLAEKNPGTSEQVSVGYVDTAKGHLTWWYQGFPCTTPAGQGSTYFPFPSLIGMSGGQPSLYCLVSGGINYGPIPLSKPYAYSALRNVPEQINYFDCQLSSDSSYMIFNGRNLQGTDLQWTLNDIYGLKLLNSVGLGVAGFGETNALIKGDTLVSGAGRTISSIPLSTAANPVATPILTLDTSVCSSISLVTLCTSTSGTDYWIMATDNNKLVVWSEGHVIFQAPYSSPITRLESDRVSMVVASDASGVTRYVFRW